MALDAVRTACYCYDMTREAEMTEAELVALGVLSHDSSKEVELALCHECHRWLLVSAGCVSCCGRNYETRGGFAFRMRRDGSRMLQEFSATRRALMSREEIQELAEHA